MRIHRLVSQIKDSAKRDLLRGYSALPALSQIELAAVRSRNTRADALAIGELLKGPFGLQNRTEGKKSALDVFRMSTTRPVDWKSELNFALGYINSVEQDVTELLPIMKKLAVLDQLGIMAALETILHLAEEYGASNYLSYKLAYLRTAHNLNDPSISSIVTNIEIAFGHRASPGLHFSAVENLSPKIALFSVAQRRISSYTSRLNGSFRSALSLHNFAPTPLCYSDLGSLILRASECSLTDTLYALLSIISLQDRFPEAYSEIKLSMRGRILNALHDIVDSSSKVSFDGLITDFYISQNSNADTSLSLYRVAASFLEKPSASIYRNNLDKVVSARLLSEVIRAEEMNIEIEPVSKPELLASKDMVIGVSPTVLLDAFMRTSLFLRYIAERDNFGYLSDDEIRFIFENTTALDSLLSEKELESFFLSANSHARALIAVLSLALFRSKSINPDVDFEFRDDFVNLINSDYGGSIRTFIDFLVEESPQVASYMVNSLDEVTLEKMYLLVKNSTQASEIRSEILRAVGTKLKRVELFVEADSIDTRAKIAKLQKYFDSSRMYVDSVALKKWLDSNPSVASEQYKSLTGAPIEYSKDGSGIDLSKLEMDSELEFLIFQSAKDAFQQFCTNNEFGIESYLGRRIRHNTLEGVTTAPVNLVLKNDEFRLLLNSATMKRATENWLKAYKDVINRLRHDRLQFGGAVPLFNSSLNTDDSYTKENLKTLNAQLETMSSDELLNDLIIQFCWRQITPQLENAARFIRTTILTEANGTIEKAFGFMNGPLEIQLKSELKFAVNEVLRKVADWFQIPQTGFIPASATQLVQIILEESTDAKPIEFVGGAINKRYTGISVHRFYDCLAALLKNACSHGAPGESIKITVESSSILDSPLYEDVSIRIVSSVPENLYLNAKQRIEGAINASETGDEMITEGYTGIRKVKFITRGSEGEHTVGFASNDEIREITLGFSIKVECANDEAPHLESA